MPGTEIKLAIQSKSVRRFLLRGLVAASLAVVVVSQPLTTFAQELPPLRENKQKLNNIVSLLRDDIEFRFLAPGIDIRTPFNSIVVAVQQPAGVETLDLLDVSDTPVLGDYMAKAIKTRLAELGISNEIAFRMTAIELQRPTADCGELRMLLSLQANEVELDGRSVFAVTVRIHSWTGAFVLQPNRKAECLGDDGPPWSGGDLEIFLVDRSDREAALAKTKEAILKFVDGALLARLVFSNDTARRTVVLWLKDGN